jgi:hypothetical protein
MVRQPFLLNDAMLIGELTFPVLDPVFEGDLQSARSGEDVQVVRHEDISSDEPSSRICPYIEYVDVILRRSQPGRSVLCAYGEKHDRRDIHRRVDAMGGSFPRRHFRKPSLSAETQKCNSGVHDSSVASPLGCYRIGPRLANRRSVVPWYRPISFRRSSAAPAPALSSPGGSPSHYERLGARDVEDRFKPALALSSSVGSRTQHHAVQMVCLGSRRHIRGERGSDRAGIGCRLGRSPILPGDDSSEVQLYAKVQASALSQVGSLDESLHAKPLMSRTHD